MQKKEIYTELEIDFYPNEDSRNTIMRFLRSLKLMAESLNKSSEIAINGGAGFAWEVKITAKGSWT
jgi:hypothetical protein